MGASAEQAPTPFGPRLIGETEKTLNALLWHCLTGTDLDEPHWATLRLAGALDGGVDAAGLGEAVRDRARFADPAALVAVVTERGLLDDRRLTEAGRDLVGVVQERIETVTATVWSGLPEDEVAAATRLLNEVVARARSVLATL